MIIFESNSAEETAAAVQSNFVFLLIFILYSPNAARIII